MRTVLSSVGLSLFLCSIGCGSAPDEGRSAPVGIASVHLRDAPASEEPQSIGPANILSAATGTIGVISKLYASINWFNCSVVGNCPETDAQAAADRVILGVETVVESVDNSGLVGDLEGLLSRSARDFSDPAALTQIGSYGEEASLLDDTETLYYEFSQKLNQGTDPTNQAEVDAAYALAPSFNVLAAFLDHLARIELVRGQAPITTATINQYRATTLATNEALVGSTNLWYSCAGASAPSIVATAWNFAGLLPVKKLWKEFADFRFATTSFSNNCDLFRLVTAPTANLCSHDCSSDFLGLCAAGAVSDNESATRYELPKVLAAMNRDPVVGAIRAANEKLAALAAEHGSGLLWRQASGEADLWNAWSGQSYEPFDLGSATLDWRPVGTGDFNGDGEADILWTTGSVASLWLMAGNQVGTMTPPTNAPTADRAFVGDLDGDGISDVVWSLPAGPAGYQTLTWMTNAGSTTPRSTSTFTSATDLIQGLGDFDADAGHQADVLYRNQTTGDVSIAFDGGGETPIAAASLDWQIAGVGDFNGDKFADVLWYNVNSGTVAVWAMQGTSIIANVTTGSSDPSGGWSIQGVGDFDHDGISDIVWRQASSGYVNFWMLAGPSSVRLMTDPVYVDPTSAVAGVLELGPATPANAPVASINEPFCGVSMGTYRNPGFTDYEPWWTSTFDGGNGTLIGDVDGDGRADLVTLGAGYVGLLPSTGVSFGAYQTAWNGSFYGSHGTFIGDVNGDGLADLVAAGDGFVGVLPSTGQIPSPHSSAPGETDYTFGSYQTWWSSSFYGSQGTFLGDVDGDGKADLVAVGSGYVGVLLSSGSEFGGYQTWYSGSFGGSAGTLFGDVNGDGKSDIVLLDAGAVTVMLSTGMSFGAPTVWFAGSFWGTQHTLLGDVDGNGRADLVAVDDASIRVMRAYSDGSSSYFGSADGGNPNYEVWWGRPWTGTHGIFIGDIDGDQRADLVAAGDGYIGAIRSQ